MGCPRRSVSFCETVRATMSEEPPAVNGTMIVMGFSGNWAHVAVAMPSAAIASVARFRIFIASPSCRCRRGSCGLRLGGERAVVREQRGRRGLHGGALLPIEVRDHRQDRPHVRD